LASLVFPLPPIVEQHRIVAKFDELMAVCDRLETQLTTTQTESLNFRKIATTVDAEDTEVESRQNSPVNVVDYICLASHNYWV
jgi:restriction endonuclease S subunit